MVPDRYRTDTLRINTPISLAHSICRAYGRTTPIAMKQVEQAAATTEAEDHEEEDDDAEEADNQEEAEVADGAEGAEDGDGQHEPESSSSSDEHDWLSYG